MVDFEADLVKCLGVLEAGGVILFPTETGWSLGCDATNEEAVQKLHQAAQLAEGNTVIVLMTDERDVLQYVAAADLAVFDFLESQKKPTAVVFEHGINLADNVLYTDGSVTIRLVRDPFCRALIKRFHKPIASTSAIRTANTSLQRFSSVAESARHQAGYIVQWQQQEEIAAQPAQTIRWNNGEAEIILSH